MCTTPNYKSIYLRYLREKREIFLRANAFKMTVYLCVYTLWCVVCLIMLCIVCYMKCLYVTLLGWVGGLKLLYTILGDSWALAIFFLLNCMAFHENGRFFSYSISTVCASLPDFLFSPSPDVRPAGSSGWRHVLTVRSVVVRCLSRTTCQIEMDISLLLNDSWVRYYVHHLVAIL